MKNSEAALQALKAAGLGLDDELKKIIAKRSGPAARMYAMLGYMLGFLDEDLKPQKGLNGGKRFRPSLCLLIADMYGARARAMDAALAIELFHNFTLIHDDVEDGDELRRGRPTLWKLFGLNHAINAGDALSIIATEQCTHASARAARILFAAFAEVIEGQYLDFEMSESADVESVNEARYVSMIEKKTSALVRASTEVAGIAAGLEEPESARLREFGKLLGLAYQLADDYRSVWALEAETGKDSYGDIRARKRTLPFIAANKELDSGKLAELYSKERPLSAEEVSEVRALIERTAARAYVASRIQEYARGARAVVATLSVSESNKALLSGVVDALIPESVSA